MAATLVLPAKELLPARVRMPLVSPKAPDARVMFDVPVPVTLPLITTLPPRKLVVKPLRSNTLLMVNVPLFCAPNELAARMISLPVSPELPIVTLPAAPASAALPPACTLRAMFWM